MVALKVITPPVPAKVNAVAPVIVAAIVLSVDVLVTESDERASVLPAAPNTTAPEPEPTVSVPVVVATNCWA